MELMELTYGKYVKSEKPGSWLLNKLLGLTCRYGLCRQTVSD